MAFSTRTTVRFAHVDPAGIVFYPRYFEMLNAAFEDWLKVEIGVDFAELHLERRIGLPTARLETEFRAPSRLGDELEIRVTPVEFGRSSCSIRYEVLAGGEERLVANAVIVCMDLAMKRSLSWPEDIRLKLAENCPRRAA
jgi:4-hydroxybenzoyl-CoA thioesterase